MHTLYLLSVWAHIVAAMTWIGGMLFLVTVMVPLLRKPGMRDRAAEVFHMFGARFRTVGWVALGTLVVTGIINLVYRGFTLAQIASGQVFAGPWGTILALKLAFVLTVLAISAVHDFWLGPRAVRLARAGAPPETRERFRRAASMLGRATLLLALAIVGLAVTLVRGS
jgi:copper resistance protein D